MNNEVTLDLQLKSDEFRRSLEELQAKILGLGNTAEQEAEATAGRVEETGKAYMELSQNIQQAVDRINTLEAATERMAASQQEARSALVQSGAAASHAAEETGHAAAQGAIQFNNQGNAVEGVTQKLAALELETAEMAAAQKQLKTAYEAGNLSMEEYVEMQGQNIARARELQMQTASLKKELTELGNKGLPVVQRSTQGLQMSINQLTKEMPAFANSAQTGFMAISNNIPMLVDEFKRLRDANDALTASGQKAPNIWKQLAASLFSWQTLLSVGITLLTLYGKEVGEWVGALFKGKEALDAQGRAMKEHIAQMKMLGEVRLNAAKAAGSELVALQEMYKATQNHNLSLKDRNAIADELQKKYPTHLGNLSNEAILAGKAAGAYRQLATAIIEAARARAAEDMIAKNQARILENEQKRADLEAGLDKKRAAYNAEKKRREQTVQTGGGAGSTVAMNDLSTGQSTIHLAPAESHTENALLSDVKAINNLRTDTEILNKRNNVLSDVVQKGIQKNGAQVVTGIEDNSRKAKAASDKASESIIASRSALIDKLQHLDDTYKVKSFSADEEELQALKQKFADFRKEVEKENEKIAAFNKKGKGKKQELIDADALINPIEERAVSDLKYRQETKRNAEALNTQKEQYKAYEQYKTAVGQEEARKRYADLLKSGQSFKELMEKSMKELSPDGTGSDLNGPMKDRFMVYKKLHAEATKEEEEQNRQRFEAAYNAVVTYEQRKAAIEKDYLSIRAQLEQVSDAGIRARKLAALEQDTNAAIDAAKDEAFQKSAIYRELNEQLLGQTRREIKQRIATIKEQLAGGAVKDPGVRASLEKDLSKAEGVLGKTSGSTQLRELNERKKKLEEILAKETLSTEQTQKTTDELVRVNAEIKAMKFADKFAQLSQDLGALGSSFTSLGGAIGQYDEGLGDTISTMGQLMDTASQVTGSIASFASGDIIGGITKAIGAITSIFSLGAQARESERKAAAEIAKYDLDQYAATLGYNALLRERERQLVRLNKLTKEGINDTGALLGSQAGTIESDFNALLKRIQSNGEQVIGKETYKYGGFLGFARKTGVRDITKALGSDITYEELERLYNTNGLTEGTKALFEQLQKLKAEGIDVKKALADVADESAQLYTGTTRDAIADSILEGFKKGYANSANPSKLFADNLRSMMKQAILQGFKVNELEKASKEWYAQFSKAADQGDLSESEIAELEASYNKMVDAQAEKFRKLGKLGIDLSDEAGDSGTLSGAIKGITAEQADLLAANMGGLRLAAVEGNGIAAANGETLREQLRAIQLQQNAIMEIAIHGKITADNSQYLSYLKVIAEKFNNNALKAAGL